MKLDTVFAGVGGQGIVTASDVFCHAAFLDGFSVTKAETHGVAQRGGSVIAHVRIGKQKIPSPLIEKGTADILLGFEILETARALPMLKDKGKVILNNTLIPPTPVLQGLSKLPRREELVEIIKEKAVCVHEIDGASAASEAGDLSSANIVLLGALFAASEILINEKSIETAISNKLKTKNLAVNLKALQLGRKSLTRG